MTSNGPFQPKAFYDSVTEEQWRAFLMTCFHPQTEATGEYNTAHQHGSSRGNDV